VLMLAQLAAERVGSRADETTTKVDFARSLVESIVEQLLKLPNCSADWSECRIAASMVRVFPSPIRSAINPPTHVTEDSSDLFSVPSCQP
jgi:hypothetical protein